MGRRVLAFFLGMLFGIILIVGGVAGAIYIAVKVIKVEQYSPEASNYIGDLASMSIYDIGQTLYTMYGEKKGLQDADGNYYSLGDLCENYNIDLTTALGMELPQEVMDMPAFEFFNGDGGFDNALKQIKVSTIPAIVNMFGGSGEDGSSNGAFGENVVAELSKYSMFDLLSNEEVGIAGVFANIRFAEILPSSFPAEDSDNKLMWAVGQTKIGGLLNGMSGSDNIMSQLNEGGAFETLGQLELSALFGEDQYITAILGADAVFADLIDEDGSIRLDDIINGVSIGELLGCQKNEIENVDGYVSVAKATDEEDSTEVKSIEKGDKTLYVKSSDGETWYEAELDCDSKEEDHVHDINCFTLVWYSATARQNGETGEATDLVDDDGSRYPKTVGLYAVLSNLSIADMTSGNDNALMNNIKKLKVRDIVNGVEISGVMETFADLTIEELMGGAIDDLYLGSFFSFERKTIAELNGYDNKITVFKQDNENEVAFYVMTDANGNIAMSNNGENWYEAKIDCDNKDEHTHDFDCYGYVWYDKDGALAEGIQGKLANKQIANLTKLNDEIKKLTLSDVLGEGVPAMLKSIAHTQIGELNDAIQDMHLGSFLEYERRLTCANEGEDHEHDDDCYAWYKLTCTDGEGHEHNDGCYEQAEGMMAKIADIKVNKLGDLNQTIKTFTLRDVLGADVPDMLQSLADTEIGDLNNAIKTMHLGDFLEYKRIVNCGKEDEAGHEHNDACYAWFKLTCDDESDGHKHNIDCYEQATGMMAKLADKTVDELGNMDSIVQDFTLRDVLGDSIPTMLADVADTPVGKVGEAIQNIYLGSALSYHRKEMSRDGYTLEAGSILQNDFPVVCKKTVDGQPILYIKSEDGKIWYEAVRNCELKHTHDKDCYGYVWYEDEDCTVPVSGIVKAFVNSKVNNVSSKMQTVTLGEMGIGGNSILDALQDTPIMEIGNEINNLKMGVVLGYTKGDKLHDTATCKETHEHNENCYDYVWYEDKAKNVIVKGLNAKIANKTIKDMSGAGLTEIATGLTIGDLIDSGMMNLGDTEAAQEENSYKLSIIYCGDNEHTFDGEITIWGVPSSKTWQCTLADYLSYSATNSNATAKEFWLKCHGAENEADLTAEQLEHRDDWQDLTLTRFISTLLSAIS